MLVSDIYGGDYASLGLSADIIASSFGKVMTFKNGKVKGEYYTIDISVVNTNCLDLFYRTWQM